MCHDFQYFLSSYYSHKRSNSSSQKRSNDLLTQRREQEQVPVSFLIARFHRDRYIVLSPSERTQRPGDTMNGDRRRGPGPGARGPWESTRRGVEEERLVNDSATLCDRYTCVALFSFSSRWFFVAAIGMWAYGPNRAGGQASGAMSDRGPTPCAPAAGACLLYGLSRRCRRAPLSCLQCRLG